MRFILSILTNTSAFDESPSVEIAKILAQLWQSKHIANHPNFSPGHDQAVYDSDGNECGFFTVYEDSIRMEIHH